MKHARKTDPISSHLAAEENEDRRPKQILMVASLVKLFPGRTTAELARKAGEDRYIIARRCPDAELKGLIVRGPMRLCEASKRLALTWWPKA